MGTKKAAAQDASAAESAAKRARVRPRPKPAEPVELPAPAAPADWKARVGELAVYPGHGVARIKEFGTKEVCGQSCEFLVLSMLSGSSSIWIPLGKISDVGLRPLVGTEEAAHIWEILRTRAKSRGPRNQTWIRQFREFQERIKNESIFGVAEVVRDLMLLQRDKELSFGEHRVLDSARTLVAEELAAVEGRDVEAVINEIKRVVAEVPDRKKTAPRTKPRTD
jgi:CarD family transcriptional regulator